LKFGIEEVEVEEVIIEAIKVLRKVDLVLGDDMKLYFE
jgi:hypothetical protein